MRLTRHVLCLALCGIATFAHGAGAGPVELIPLPAQLTYAGEAFTVTAQTPIVVDAGDADAGHTADYLAELTARTRHLPLQVKHAPVQGAAIVLKRDAEAPVSNAEGYTLDVTPQGIRVVAREEAGLFYGAITAWQLM